MNILHLLYAGGIGGIEKLCKDIATYDKTDKNWFAFVHAGGSIYEEMKEQKKEVMLWKLNNYNVIAMCRYLTKFCRQKQIDYVVIHHPSPLLWMGVLLYQRTVHKPAKVIVYAHNSFEEMIAHKKWKGFLYKRLLKNSCHIVAISHFVKQTIVEMGHMNPEKIAVIYNGVANEKYRMNHEYEPGKPLQLLYIGRLIPQKGLQVLLMAMSLLNNKWEYELTIVGDGPYREMLEKQVKADKLETLVSFVGEQTDILPYLRSANVFVHPAIWEEGFGISVVEAMSAGLPCVAFKRGALPEIIEDEVNGFLVKEVSAQALAEKLTAISALFKQEALTQLQIRTVARAMRFGMQELLNQLHDVYQECI